jgi:tRNA-specific 2-thiouridylase
MSGGVDSSVAAALLKQQGYDVVGMMLRLWSEPGKEDSNRCCTPDSMAQARRVAAKLDIPFYVVDAKDVFRRTVVEYFLEGYASGTTPNPCMACNRTIRWEYLLNHALALGADFVATGHYARVQTAADGHRQLIRALDLTKDQSYILHVLTQEKLARALFPVGDYPKTEIRAMAEALGLSTAKRPDSQDLCFLSGEDYRAFLKRNAPEMLCAGAIVTRAGEVVGQHTGLPDYTIGQRKGLGIASPVPLYVLAKDPASNALIVGPADQLGSCELLASGVNWTSGRIPTHAFRADVKSRYTGRLAAAEILPLENGTGFRARFDAPQRDLTPGQAAVIYEREHVLGGGVITHVLD